MYKESDQLPRRMLRRQGGFYDEDDCLPNEVSAPDSVVPAVDPQPSKSLIRTGGSPFRNRRLGRFCRICFSDEELDNGQLCSPCNCRGSMYVNFSFKFPLLLFGCLITMSIYHRQFVHIRCLERWKEDQLYLQRPVQCEQCSHSYTPRTMSLSRKVAHWGKFQRLF